MGDCQVLGTQHYVIMHKGKIILLPIKTDPFSLPRTDLGNRQLDIYLDMVES